MCEMNSCGSIDSEVGDIVSMNVVADTMLV